MGRPRKPLALRKALSRFQSVLQRSSPRSKGMSKAAPAPIPEERVSTALSLDHVIARISGARAGIAGINDQRDQLAQLVIVHGVMVGHD
jgi:hypothetical protein